jgi:hypothetical protein
MNFKEWFEKLPKFLILVISLELIFGLAFLAIPIRIIPNQLILFPLSQLDQTEQNALKTEIGIALIIAALLTSTFEPITRRLLDRKTEEAIKKIEENSNLRTQEVIKKIENTSGLKILSEISGDERIYEAIKTHVFMYPYVRKGFSTRIRLDWLNDQKDYLIMTRLVSFYVKNLTSGDVYYPIEAFEDISPNLGSLFQSKFIRVETFWVVKPAQENIKEEVLDKIWCYKWDELMNDNRIYLDEQNWELKLKIDGIKIAPNQTLKVITEVESAFQSQYRYPFVLPKIADGLSIKISHPIDLKVWGVPLHPEDFSLHSNDEKFSKEYNDLRKFQHWKINAGILPYQGVELNWKVLLGDVEDNVDKNNHDLNAV